MTIFNHFQDEMFKNNKDLKDLRDAEIKAITNPGTKIKVVSGMYIYLPINGTEVFILNKLGSDWCGSGYFGMWELVSAKPGSELGDYDFTLTLKEAIESANASAINNS